MQPSCMSTAVDDDEAATAAETAETVELETVDGAVDGKTLTALTTDGSTTAPITDDTAPSTTAHDRNAMLVVGRGLKDVQRVDGRKKESTGYLDCMGGERGDND